jgi:hypothetical protein
MHFSDCTLQKLAYVHMLENAQFIFYTVIIHVVTHLLLFHILSFCLRNFWQWKCKMNHC